ncbi:outer membrane lipoprotein-sorting protein [candidate division KSB1 bacterium 4484_87]|nr:MAG: outer membrane lipoprotein-sorting protein [candidate division KSB1 bacterium 4484_87]
MKKIIWGLAILLFAFSSVQAQSLTAEEIIQKVNALMNQKSVYAKARMTIVTTSGKKRTFEYESWSKDSGEKNLIRYTAPHRVKGQAILMLNNADDIWAYFPRTRRVRKLASHAKKQKMQGSDFSYEDMGTGDAFVNDFTAEKLKDEKIEGFDCYKVELTRKKGADSQYSRLICWVIKKNFFPVVIDYYDDKNPDIWVKRMVQKDIREIDGIPTGLKIVMYNKNDNTQTEMEFLEVKYNFPLSDDMFSERSLAK